MAVRKRRITGLSAFRSHAGRAAFVVGRIHKNETFCQYIHLMSECQM
jgi:hypothetical protein